VNLIKIEDLSKSYIDAEVRRDVLCNVDLSVNQGEFLAIQGRSGSGKTTLLNLIAGIDDPDSGEISIDGISIHQLNGKERANFRRDHIGFVFQFFNLLPTLTVIENVSLPAELGYVAQSAATDMAFTLLEKVGLADRKDDFPDQLSGGEQQRVAIARAIIQKPRVLLADEPTGNLDSGMGDQVLGLLMEMTRPSDLTLILVTHSHEIAARADRTLVIKDCQIRPAGQGA
jgi:putative ABC transport system ATP-binding protein